MRPDVTYTPCATSSREQTGDIITFAQFEEGDLSSEPQNLLSDTRDDAESSNKSDDYSKIPKLCGMENITTEEVMYKLDMFQSIFGKIDEF